MVKVTFAKKMRVRLICLVLLSFIIIMYARDDQPLMEQTREMQEQKIVANVEKHTASFAANRHDCMKPALERPLSYKPTGFGEFGARTDLKSLTSNEKEESALSVSQYGINQFLSDKISLHRTLKDPRPPQ